MTLLLRDGEVSPPGGSGIVAVSHLPPGSIYKKQPLNSFFQHQSPSLIYSSCKQQKKKSKAGPRRGVIFYMDLLCFNQPTKTHLISMLMRLARSLLVRRCLYAVWLERNNNAVPIRDLCNSPVPMQHSPVAPDRTLALPNLISYRIGGDAHTHTHVHHTSLGQLLSRVAFMALDWRMELLNQ